MIMDDKYYDCLMKKRKVVLEKLQPICNAFGYDCDYVINRNYGQTETLIINGTRIGCTDNSEYAIIREFIGYLFINIWCKDRSFPFRTQIMNCVKRYWLN